MFLLNLVFSVALDNSSKCIENQRRIIGNALITFIIVTCFQEINDRMEYLINKIVRQITAHAESLHEEVEVMAKVRNNQSKINITSP